MLNTPLCLDLLVKYALFCYFVCNCNSHHICRQLWAALYCSYFSCSLIGGTELVRTLLGNYSLNLYGKLDANLCVPSFTSIVQDVNVL